MNKFYNETFLNLETVIKEIESKSDNSLQRIEAVIIFITQCLAEVKEYVIKKWFNNVEEEIRFFKYQKPAIVAKLIYYNAVYKIEAKKPYGGKEVMEAYLKTELTKLKRFFDNNMAFFSYYRTNSDYLDHIYFVRGKHDIKLSLDTFYFEADHSFSTSHDYKVAKIIANDLLQGYLEGQLSDNVKEDKSQIAKDLNWTGSKTALTELIYALYSQGVFNNGNAQIKAIVKVFERTLNVDLGDFYHTYLELKSRKINCTKFLDSLKASLIAKINTQDER